MTNQELQAIKDRLARLAVHSSVMALEVSKDLITLIAEVEQLRAIIAQGADGAFMDTGANEHHIARPGRTP